MPTYEGLRLRLLRYNRNTFAKNRRKKLTNENFTIISNNCWGGMIYESYGLEKMSPTAGLFFMASDYIKFLENLDEYLQADLCFIKPEESKWKSKMDLGEYPIGKLKDIEIFFLHYESEEEAKAKWNRRCKRINKDKLIVKFNDQNGCTLEDVEKFLQLPYKNKIFFTCKDWNIKHHGEIIKVRQSGNKDFIRASYEPFGKTKYLDMHKYINLL